MKQPIVKAVMAAMLSGGFFASNAQEKVIRLDPVDEKVYNLTYKYKNASDVKVQLIDVKGSVLYTDHIHRNKSFVRPYRMENLPEGLYTLKVTDRDGEYVALLDRAEKNKLTASILAVGSNKAKVVVRGESSGPVYVKVFDRFGGLVFKDEVYSTAGFSRLYDLSGVSENKLKIEVLVGNDTLAGAELK